MYSSQDAPQNSSHSKPLSSVKGVQAQTISASSMRTAWQHSAQGQSCLGILPTECVPEVGRSLGTDPSPSCTLWELQPIQAVSRERQMLEEVGLPALLEQKGSLQCINWVIAGWPCPWTHAAPPGDSKIPWGIWQSPKKACEQMEWDGQVQHISAHVALLPTGAGDLEKHIFLKRGQMCQLRHLARAECHLITSECPCHEQSPQMPIREHNAAPIDPQKPPVPHSWVQGDFLTKSEEGAVTRAQGHGH